MYANVPAVCEVAAKAPESLSSSIKYQKDMKDSLSSQPPLRIYRVLYAGFCPFFYEPNVNSY